MKSNKEIKGNTLMIRLLSLGFIVLVSLFLIDIKIRSYDKNYSSFQCIPITQGTIKIEYLLEKYNDKEERNNFCRSMGFQYSYQSTELRIGCYKDNFDGSTTYKNFNIMVDFANYIYNRDKEG